MNAGKVRCWRSFPATTPFRAVPFDALFLWDRFSLCNAVQVSQRAFRYQRALSVRAFSFCAWRRWAGVLRIVGTLDVTPTSQALLRAFLYTRIRIRTRKLPNTANIDAKPCQELCIWVEPSRLVVYHLFHRRMKRLPWFIHWSLP